MPITIWRFSRTSCAAREAHHPELKRAAELASAYLDSLDTRRVSEEPDPGALRAKLSKKLTRDGLPPLQVIEELAEDAKDGLLQSAGGRFFGWVIGGGIPVAIAADWLTSAWDQNAAAFACSPTAAIIEDVVAEWLKDILGLPPQASYAFVADPEAHRTAITVPAAYKVEIQDVRDQLDWGPEWSRRARGIPLHAALRNLGRNGVAEMIERCCDLTSDMVRKLGALSGVEVLTTPIINQGLVRFLGPSGHHDERTEEVIKRVNESGEAWFGATTWKGMRVMRISVSNFRTSSQDVDRAIAALERALRD